MTAILALDAAWTERAPSGVALLRDDAPGWRCVALAPSYDAFLALACGRPIDWGAPAFKGSLPKPKKLLQAAQFLLRHGRIDLVTVDMPLALGKITGRRAADDAVSKAFGGRGCGAHTPSAARPGRLSKGIADGFAASDFPLATRTTAVGTARRLVEVYPHPALLVLLGAEYRVRYKASRTLRYWPDASLDERIARLLDAWGRILATLHRRIACIDLDIPRPRLGLKISRLKRYEDALDAVIRGWIGTEYLAGRADAYGDASAAIWVPRGDTLTQPEPPR